MKTKRRSWSLTSGEQDPTPPVDHQWLCCGEGEQHQISRHAHHRRPLPVQQHCITCQKSTAAPLRSPQSEEGQSPTPFKCSFYRCSIESITSCITAWFGICSTSNCKTLQRIVSECSRGNHWCLTPPPPGHLQQPCKS